MRPMICTCKIISEICQNDNLLNETFNLFLISIGYFQCPIDNIDNSTAFSNVVLTSIERSDVTVFQRRRVPAVCHKESDLSKHIILKTRRETNLLR